MGEVFRLKLQSETDESIVKNKVFAQTEKRMLKPR